MRCKGLGTASGTLLSEYTEGDGGSCRGGRGGGGALDAISLPGESTMFGPRSLESTTFTPGPSSPSNGQAVCWDIRGPGGRVAFSWGTRILGRLPTSSISLARRTDPFLSAGLGSDQPCFEVESIVVERRLDFDEEMSTL